MQPTRSRSTCCPLTRCCPVPTQISMWRATPVIQRTVRCSQLSLDYRLLLYLQGFDSQIARPHPRHYSCASKKLSSRQNRSRDAARNSLPSGSASQRSSRNTRLKFPLVQSPRSRTARKFGEALNASLYWSILRLGVSMRAISRFAPAARLINRQATPTLFRS